jgi:hypothetical protein
MINFLQGFCGFGTVFSGKRAKNGAKWAVGRQKFDDTAEKEAFQFSKIVKIPDLQGRPCLIADSETPTSLGRVPFTEISRTCNGTRRHYALRYASRRNTSEESQGSHALRVWKYLKDTQIRGPRATKNERGT